MLLNWTGPSLCYGPEAMGCDMGRPAEAQALLENVPTAKEQGQRTNLCLGSLEFTSLYVSLGSNVKHFFFLSDSFLDNGQWLEDAPFSQTLVSLSVIDHSISKVTQHNDLTFSQGAWSLLVALSPGFNDAELQKALTWARQWRVSVCYCSNFPFWNRRISNLRKQ